MRESLALGLVLLIAGLGVAGCGADTPAGQLEQSTRKAEAVGAAAWEACEALNAAALQQDPAGRSMARAPVDCGPRPAGAAER
jgi:hypothetical protein